MASEAESVNFLSCKEEKEPAAGEANDMQMVRLFIQALYIFPTLRSREPMGPDEAIAQVVELALSSHTVVSMQAHACLLPDV